VKASEIRNLTSEMKNEKMNILDSTLRDLENLHEGQPWFGESFDTHLQNLDWKKANAEPFEDGRSIHRLVLHIIEWRRFAIEKLAENDFFDLKYGSKDEWPPIRSGTEGWKTTLEQLTISQKKLIQAIRATKNDFLEKKVPNRDYDFHYLLVGTVQHDIYHLGQIALMKTLL
jgi:uncharacterized damage-inducible protein DinB